jgi:hypothetical protein
MRLLLASLVAACVNNSPPPPVDGPGSGPTCGNLAGTWGVDGTCGADVCVVTQDGCSTTVACSNGAASYAGSITGNDFTYSGTTASGIPATCNGTLSGNALSASCVVESAPCTVNGVRR